MSLLIFVAAFAADPAAAAADSEMPADPRVAFCEQMTDVSLVGRFTRDAAAGTPREDRYRIQSIKPLRDDLYVVTSQIVYTRASGNPVDITVPITVTLLPAGDLTVLSVRDLSIPFLGDKFAASIVFDGDRYAGTWAHGPVGGHLWGKVEAADGDAANKPEETK